MDIDTIEPFFKGEGYYIKTIKEQLSNGITSLFLDWDKINEWNEDVANELLENPDDVLGVLSQVASTHNEKGEEINVHITNVPKVISVRELSTEHNFKLITIKGIIAQVSEIKSKAIEGIWRCRRGNCGAENKVFYTKYDENKPPLKCSGCNKRSNFSFVPEASKYIDYKYVSVSERPEDLPAGQIAKSVPVILLDDLVNGPRAGDLVLISGVVRLREDDKKERTFTKIIEANYILTESKEYYKTKISEKEEKEILELSEDPYIYERIIDSLAPSIFGLEHIKEGGILLLFGGVRKDKGDITTRGDIHMLVIGDPATAKSQLLITTSKLAPRGIFCSGKRASAAGLTASVVKIDGRWTLQAGALILGDMGMVCIDELDKMDEQDRCALHEAMEQQRISVNKAGINSTNNSRCSIFAACNPTFGRYDTYKTIIENVNLNPTLLSRFDLIFILKDIPFEKTDRLMVDHMYGKNKENPHLIPHEILKKYIAYAHRINPTIGKEAYEHLKTYYLKARSTINQKEDSPITISPRQFEGLMRLTEAVARIYLRKEAVIKDAQRAISIFYKSIKQCGIDPVSGKIDIDLIMGGKPKTVRDNMKAMEDILTENGEMTKNKLIEEAEKVGIKDPLATINQLRENGIIFNPRGNVVKKAR